MRLLATPDRVVEELSRIAFFNMKDVMKSDGSLIPFTDLPRSVTAAIKRVTISYSESETEDGSFNLIKHVHFEPHNKLDALDKLAKHLQLFDGPIKVENNVAIVSWDSLLNGHHNGTQEITLENDPIEQQIRSIGSGEVSSEVRGQLENVSEEIDIDQSEDEEQQESESEQTTKKKTSKKRKKTRSARRSRSTAEG
jgi:Mg-chelatase subunit ChlI